MPLPLQKVRIAVAQSEPIWLDLDGTIEKTCKLITEAAANGAQLIAFPECWVPGYPVWIWPLTRVLYIGRLRSRPVDSSLTTTYMHNALKVPSPKMTSITESAATNKIIVVLGYTENIHESLYIAQAIISAEGEILTTRKKLKPTHMERTIFGDSGGDCLNSVVDTKTDIGRVGALSCWEHLQPLLKYHTYAQRERIHVAAWPPIYPFSEEDGNLFSISKEGAEAISRTYAIESQSFVLHCTTVLSQDGIDRMGTQNGGQMNVPGGGGSAVFAPDGRKITEDLPATEEGIIYADLDVDEICKARGFVDVCGHYSRPDLLWLGVKEGVLERVVRAEDGASTPD
ncbi:carbon-nitrogen hydrolase family protein [Aspergillus undulatus]|uniref:carbon-nitrogen hydrolase family protein n=1 Tax=Aspergillus undulatus TaxID=1810928 RepID=UPI003CCD6A55